MYLIASVEWVLMEGVESQPCLVENNKRGFAGSAVEFWQNTSCSMDIFLFVAFGVKEEGTG